MGVFPTGRAAGGCVEVLANMDRSGGHTAARDVRSSEGMEEAGPWKRRAAWAIQLP